VLDEGTLRERYPEIPWDQPVLIEVAGGGHYYVCRYCVASIGVRARDLEAKRVPFAFEFRGEALDHIEAVHHD
jgi:hypothetical protein